MLKQISIIGLISLSLCFFAGCGQETHIPLASGKVVSGMIWEQPVGGASNKGSEIAAGSRVDIYENFIIVTPPNGPSILSPHGWYTDLKFEKK